MRILQGTSCQISEVFPKEITPDKEKWELIRQKGKDRKGLAGTRNSMYRIPGWLSG